MILKLLYKDNEIILAVVHSNYYMNILDKNKKITPITTEEIVKTATLKDCFFYLCDNKLFLLDDTEILRTKIILPIIINKHANLYLIVKWDNGIIFSHLATDNFYIFNNETVNLNKYSNMIEKHYFTSITNYFKSHRLIITEKYNNLKSIWEINW